MVADWGGDWTGLDVAEALAARGCRCGWRSARRVRPRRSTSTSATRTWSGSTWPAWSSSTTCGRSRRSPARRAVRNVFSDREVVVDGVDTVVASGGRRFERLFEALTAEHGRVVRVGDCLGPRSIEEAIREGTRAALGVPLEI